MLKPKERRGETKMKKTLLLISVTAALILAAIQAGEGFAADFTNAPLNVPMRWSGTVTNIPDSSTVTVGTDQDITVSYSSATDRIYISGQVQMNGILVGNDSSAAEAGSIYSSGGGLYLHNGTSWVTVKPSPAP
jgi:hypothetical protein